MRRYWYQGHLQTGEVGQLTGDLFHHICGVCRQGVGNKFELLSEGVAFFVEITVMSKKSAEFKVLEQRELPPLPQPHIHLCLSLPKFSKVDLILE